MFRIIKQEEVAPGHCLMSLDAPEIASRAAPGQFLHLRCADTQDPLLRRPISIHYADRERGLVYILYRVAGRGTALLARRAPGDCLDVMGPLGKGFSLPSGKEKTAVIGGGMGVAPLFFLLKEIEVIYRHDSGRAAVFIGAATSGALLGVKEFGNTGFPVYIATDDGSAGFNGNVVDLFRRTAGGNGFDRVYACGPLPMLISLAAGIRPGQIAEVSVEERMGCGVGACLSCACRVRGRGGEDFRYAHVCRDGPVFNLNDLMF
jgi:dihydroorotate dehydrogenase electron transfer subunit